MPVLNQLVRYCAYGGYALVAFFLVGTGVSVIQFSHARRARYYILRETARRRATRWLIGSLVSLALGLVLCTLPHYLSARLQATATPFVSQPPTPSPAPPLSPETPPETLPPPATATQTPVRTATPTRRATATPPFIPTPTPPFPLPETALTPLPSAIPAGAEARITIVTFARGEDGGRPVEPGSEFPSDDERVYAFIEYEGMDRGVTWTYGWYAEGDYLEGNTCLWGIATDECPRIFGRTGGNYLFFRPPGGYDPGTYEVRIWIEGRFQTSEQFIITAVP